MEFDASHHRFVIDHNRYILCTRRVRVCDEIEGAHTWDVMGRGIDAKVITDLSEPWGLSETCTSCEKCVHVCPTGALFEKGPSVAELLKRRQLLPYLSLMREETNEQKSLTTASVLKGHARLLYWLQEFSQMTREMRHSGVAG